MTSDEEITGEVVPTPHDSDPFRVVVRRGGRVISYLPASSEAEAIATLDSTLQAVEQARRQVG